MHDKMSLKRQAAPTGAGHGANHGMPRVDYAKSPFLIIWETTQACGLACSHCRASAQPNRLPGELTTEEGEDVLRQAKDLGTPIFVLTGGDPLKRPDLFRLIRSGAKLGLRMATIPAATELLTEEVVKNLKRSGLSQMAQSLDFPVERLHDGFRGVPGAFAKTMQAVGWARKHGLAVQINTVMCGQSAPYIEQMAELVAGLGAVFWEVFFLVPMGRGKTLRGLTAEQCEELFAILYRVQKDSEFLVKVTEAPHYRRYVTQREWQEGSSGLSPSGETNRPGAQGAAGKRTNQAVPVKNLPRQLIRTEGPGHSIGLARQGVNAGNGFLFISHTGEVFPSGFLPISVGNVRKRSLRSLYRESDLFRQLRNPDEFRGACGGCEFNRICGGSRSRAYALTGDYLATDPWCAYRPPVSLASQV